MKTLKSLFLLAILAIAVVSCTPNTSQVTVNASESVGENLNLQALGDLVKSSKNPQDIEAKLNQPNGINNLDLDNDGKADYLTVTEYGSGSNHGYSICDELADGKQEVAKIEVDIQNSTMTVNGNQNYYGNNNNYQSSFSATDMMLLMWMTQPHYNYYVSPYHYGYYGYGYHPYARVPYGAYYNRPYVHTARTSTTYRTVTTHTSTIKSPNNNAVSHTAMSRSINNGSSRKSFSTTPRSRSLNTGGFRSNSSSSSSYSRPNSSYHSSPSRSSGSFHSSSSGRRR